LEKAGLKILNEGSLTVALDTTLTAELREEGAVRDLLRGVQNLRKASGLEVSDRIRLSVSGEAGLRGAFERWRETISSETLATDAAWRDADNSTEVDSDAGKWRIAIEKA
jgi:isoleucyl-tRNA synthetase